MCGKDVSWRGGNTSIENHIEKHLKGNSDETAEVIEQELAAWKKWFKEVNNKDLDKIIKMYDDERDKTLNIDVFQTYKELPIKFVNKSNTEIKRYGTWYEEYSDDNLRTFLLLCNNNKPVYEDLMVVAKKESKATPLKISSCYFRKRSKEILGQRIKGISFANLDAYAKRVPANHSRNSFLIVKPDKNRFHYLIDTNDEIVNRSIAYAMSFSFGEEYSRSMYLRYAFANAFLDLAELDSDKRLIYDSIGESLRLGELVNVKAIYNEYTEITDGINNLLERNLGEDYEFQDELASLFIYLAIVSKVIGKKFNKEQLKVLDEYEFEIEFATIEDILEYL